MDFQIPTIGAPFAVESWWVAVVITCHVCPPPHPLVTLPNGQGQCPHCKTVFHFAAFKTPQGEPIPPHMIGLTILIAKPTSRIEGHEHDRRES